MERRRHVRLSKRLAYHLRHDPGAAGVGLDAAGWVDVDELVAALDGVSHADVRAVVHGSDAQRFELSPDGGRIRARYGHSVPVALGHGPARPPTVLFHGTATAHAERILREGLDPMGRQQVHLSETSDQALTVGRRHGEPVVLSVAARRMHDDGIVFTDAADGVWLVDRVPPEYLSPLR